MEIGILIELGILPFELVGCLARDNAILLLFCNFNGLIEFVGNEDILVYGFMVLSLKDY